MTAGAKKTPLAVDIDGYEGAAPRLAAKNPLADLTAQRPEDSESAFCFNDA